VTSTSDNTFQGDTYLKNGGDDGAGTRVGDIWYSVSTGGGAAPVGVYESAVITTVKNGTHGRSDMVFKTKDNDTANFGTTSERMRITKEGNVGIGTTDPEKKLHIIGTSSDTAGAGLFAIEGDAGNVSWVFRSTDTGDNLAIDREYGGAGSYYNTLTLQRSTGNVGIGVTGPASKLTIDAPAGNFANGANAISLNYNGGPSPGDVGGGIVFSQKWYSASTVQQATGGIFGIKNGGNGSYGGGLAFYTQPNSAASMAQHMVIRSTGEVGIGITAPNESLHVHKDATPRIILTDGTTGTTSGSDGMFLGIASDQGFNIWNYENTYTRFAVNNSEAMRITSAGFVGIGTESPLKPLQVDGAIAAQRSGVEGVYARRELTGAGHELDVPSGYHSLLVKNNGSEQLRITSAGLVGIGTTAPSSTLTIKGGSEALRFERASQETYRILHGTSGLYFSHPNSGALLLGLTQNGDITVSNDQSAEYVRFDNSSSSVGIGTTSPSSKLQVAGGIQMSDDTDTAVAGKVGTMRYRTGTEYVEVDGVELVINGDFATDTDWTKGANTTISGGTLNSTAIGVYIIANTAASLITGSLYYRFRYTITVTSGSVRLGASSGVWGSAQSTSGTYTGVQQAAASINGLMYFTSPSSDFVGSIDNVSVVEVTAEDASYADMCMQTGASTYEWVNIVRNTY
jgi:hypothetical protein